VPSLVAAARGADVTATDWAADAIGLLRRNARRNGLALRAEVRDWREPWDERFDLAVAADVLYEHRNVEPLLRLLPQLAPETLLGLAGRPHERDAVEALNAVEVAPRVVRARHGALPGPAETRTK
jgi:predicted nicotinamide N-methyase